MMLCNKRDSQCQMGRMQEGNTTYRVYLYDPFIIYLANNITFKANIFSPMSDFTIGHSSQMTPSQVVQFILLKEGMPSGETLIGLRSGPV